MPILYPFACVFYMLHYWVYKFLLTKYYAKTTKFNQQLPMYSMNFIKIGLFFHIICGGFMITNSEIIPSESAISALKEEVLDGLEIKETEVEARFNASEHGQFYLAFIVLIIVFLILKNTVFFLLIKVFKKLFNGITCGACNKDDKECMAHCFYNELKVKSLKALYVKTCGEVKAYEELQSKGIGKA
jgi:hypothetical protein